MIGSNHRFNATATIVVRTVNGGDRVIPFDLLPAFRVTRVSSGGQDVPFIQESRKEDAGFYVVLPSPLARGAKTELTIEYSGDKVLQDAGGGNFSVRAHKLVSQPERLSRPLPIHLTFKVPVTRS